MTENNHKTVLTGGCQCGAIRCAMTKAPAKVSICHCRMCQKASGAAIACLCSSDKVYAEHAVAAAKALQAAGARHIYLAGRPGEQEAALRSAGVGNFIFAGGDALAMLREAWRRME